MFFKTYLKPLAIVTMLGCFAISSIQAADARVRISERTKYYTVTGKTSAQLLKSVARKGPRKGHAYASTRTQITVKNVKTGIRGRKCVVISSDVIPKLTYTYPRWRNPRGASAKTQNAWNKFYQLVRKHEETHGRISKKYARTLEKTINGLTGRVSRRCTDFKRKADRRLRRLERGWRKEHIRFDKRESRKRARVRRAERALKRAR